MSNLLPVAFSPRNVMTTDRHGGVGLSHPTVVPTDERTDDEADGDASAGPRCPECGHPVADHDRR